MLSSIENISHTLTNSGKSVVTTSLNNTANNSSAHINSVNGNTNAVNIIIGNNAVSGNNGVNIINKTPENISSQNNTDKLPKAILMCHPGSHSFLDRTVILDKPVKIGRSVGHAKATLNNGIFDCKVLSRNHALIWYSDGKFYLKDTKSSNGTFVNRERLSRSIEESNPHEIYSDDTVQFGVDVVESSHNVTHGCIIATLKLILPDGREAKPKPMTIISSTVNDKGKISLEDLYHLNEYIQEALQREQMLEAKLGSLRQLVQTLKDSTELSWKALISNNSLLSRVELLEVQLQCYSKKFQEDKLREELRLLQEDKTIYQGAVKEFFQKIVDEKLEAVQRYQDIARALGNSRTECNNTKQLLTGCQAELRELAHKNTLQENIIEEFEAKLSLAEESNKELQEKLTETSNALRERIRINDEREDSSRRAIRKLEARGDCAEKQVASLQEQIEQLQTYHNEILRQLINPDAITNNVNNVELIRSWVFIYTQAQADIEECVGRTKNKLDEIQNDVLTEQQKINTMESDVRKYAAELEELKDEHVELEHKIALLERELDASKPAMLLDCPPLVVDDDIIIDKKSASQFDLKLLELQDKKKLHDVIRRNVDMVEGKRGNLEAELQKLRERNVSLTTGYAMEEHKLRMAEKQNTNLNAALTSLRRHLENSNAYHQDLIPVEEVQNLKRQLSEAHEISLDRQNTISCLTRYFSEFTNIVNQKLNVLEASIGEFVDFNDDLSDLEEAVKSVKSESVTLTNAVTDLQTILFECLSSSSSSYGAPPPNNSIDIPDDRSKVDIEHLCRRISHPVVETVAIDNDHDEMVALKRNMVILKEKYRFVLNEKSLLKEQLSKLRAEYDCAISYPYFDLCFIMPIVILVSIIFFKYGNVFSVFTGTFD